MLFGGLYHPPNQSNNYFYENIGNALDNYTQYYDYFLAGDFNNQESTICLRNFLEEYEAKNLVKENTFFKSVSNPSCIDLFLTNNPHKFWTGLSDYHKMIITAMKGYFKKNKPKKISYREYRNGNKEDFRSELRCVLNTNDTSTLIP